MRVRRQRLVLGSMQMQTPSFAIGQKVLKNFEEHLTRHRESLALIEPAIRHLNATV